jgi:hypothetical protein
MANFRHTQMPVDAFHRNRVPLDRGLSKVAPDNHYVLGAGFPLRSRLRSPTGDTGSVSEDQRRD